MSVEIKDFGTEHSLYVITNSTGMSVSLTDLGATVQSINVPDRDGEMRDVVLGYDTPEEYLKNDAYVGASVGRYANRIGGAHFELNGVGFDITANEGENTLHGGKGFDKRSFSAAVGDNSVSFTLHDPDGGDGFPGDLDVCVKYTLTDENALVIDYFAESDRDTVINLTNHSYFNLNGGGTALSHELRINAEHYLTVDAGLIPTGELAPVEGTAFDFRSLRLIKDGFYDHCFVLSGTDCAELYSADSGIKMCVATDMPAVQFYCAGSLGSRQGKNGAVYEPNYAVCLETQRFPDAPNKPDFPSSLLKAGDKFTSRTVYTFSAD